MMFKPVIILVFVVALIYITGILALLQRQINQNRKLCLRLDDLILLTSLNSRKLEYKALVEHLKKTKSKDLQEFLSARINLLKKEIKVLESSLNKPRS